MYTRIFHRSNFNGKHMIWWEEGSTLLKYYRILKFYIRHLSNSTLASLKTVSPILNTFGPTRPFFGNS